VLHESDDTMTESEIILSALTELERARRLYPEWPADLVHAAAVVSEEVGEVTKGCNDLYWHQRGTVDDIRTEAIQAIAMLLRFLAETPRMKGD